LQENPQNEHYVALVLWLVPQLFVAAVVVIVGGGGAAVCLFVYYSFHFVIP